MVQEVKLKTEEERKAALDAALARVRPVVKANVEKDNSVMSRLSKIANAAPEKEQEKDKAKAKDKKPLSLIDIAKKQADLDKEAKKHGVDPVSKKSKKDEKEDAKEKDKDKKKDKEKEDPVAKKEKEMKEMISKARRPGSIDIKEEGSSWVLYSADGKHKTDVTEIMEAIDKFNRNVDDVNEQNRMQNAAQSGVDKAVDTNKKEASSDRDRKIQIVAEALPNVKDVDGKQVFTPEQAKDFAEIAIDYSNGLRELEAMKREAKKLEEEANNRRKKNDRESDERNAKDAQRMQQQMQKMQNSM